MAVTTMILATLGPESRLLSILYIYYMSWNSLGRRKDNQLFTWHKWNKDQCERAEFDDDQKVTDILFIWP